jgi:hypothetical protein
MKRSGNRARVYNRLHDNLSVNRAVYTSQGAWKWKVEGNKWKCTSNRHIHEAIHVCFVSYVSTFSSPNSFTLSGFCNGHPRFSRTCSMVSTFNFWIDLDVVDTCRWTWSSAFSFTPSILAPLSAHLSACVHWSWRSCFPCMSWGSDLNIGWCFTVFFWNQSLKILIKSSCLLLNVTPRSHISYRNCSRIVGFVGKTYGFSAIRTCNRWQQCAYLHPEYGSYRIACPCSCSCSETNHVLILETTYELAVISVLPVSPSGSMMHISSTNLSNFSCIFNGSFANLERCRLHRRLSNHHGVLPSSLSSSWDQVPSLFY